MTVRSIPPGERRPLSFLAAAAWTIGAVFAVRVAIEITEAVRPGARGDLINVAACFVLTYSIVIFVMLRVYEPETPVRRVLAMRRCSIPGTFFAIVAGVSIHPAFERIEELLERRFPTPQEDQELL